MLKHFVIILVIYLSSLQLYSQDIIFQNKNLDSIVVFCIEHHVKYFSKGYDHKITDTMYFVKEEFKEREIIFPDHVGITPIKQITGFDINERTKKKKCIVVTFLNPIVIKERSIIFNLVYFGISQKRNMFRYINNGNSEYKIEYDCELQIFKVYLVKQGAG